MAERGFCHSGTTHAGKGEAERGFCHSGTTHAGRPLAERLLPREPIRANEEQPITTNRPARGQGGPDVPRPQRKSSSDQIAERRQAATVCDRVANRHDQAHGARVPRREGLALALLCPQLGLEVHQDALDLECHHLHRVGEKDVHRPWVAGRHWMLEICSPGCSGGLNDRLSEAKLSRVAQPYAAPRVESQRQIVSGGRREPRANIEAHLQIPSLGSADLLLANPADSSEPGLRQAGCEARDPQLAPVLDGQTAGTGSPDSPGMRMR
jgi:hypothetical protein